MNLRIKPTAKLRLKKKVSLGNILQLSLSINVTVLH